MIHMQEVSKVYENGAVALNHVNIDIAKGEFVFIVGASGAGKSTFIKLLLREVLPHHEVAVSPGASQRGACARVFRESP